MLRQERNASGTRLNARSTLAVLFAGQRSCSAPSAALGGSMAYLLIIGFTALLPESLVIGTIMIVGQAALGYLLANQLQGTAIRYHLARGGKAHSNFRAAGIGLLTGFAIMFAVVLVATLSGRG